MDCNKDKCNKPQNTFNFLPCPDCQFLDVGNPIIFESRISNSE